MRGRWPVECWLRAPFSGLAMNAFPTTWTTLRTPPALRPNAVATLPGFAALMVTPVPASSPARA